MSKLTKLQSQRLTLFSHWQMLNLNYQLFLHPLERKHLLEFLRRHQEPSRNNLLQLHQNWNNYGGGNQQSGSPKVDESGLSLKKLDEFNDQLQELQTEKVLEFVTVVDDLCDVLGIDFYSTVIEVHPSLNDATGV